MRLRNKKGFTLIELIMVIVIIGILAGIAIPTFANLVRQAREGATRGALGAVRSTLAIRYAQSAATQAGGGLATYPDALVATDFADGQFPLNALTGFRGDVTVLAAPPAAVANYVGAGCPAACTQGFWYVSTTAATVATDAGRSGAYVDRTTDLQDSPDTW